MFSSPSPEQAIVVNEGEVFKKRTYKFNIHPCNWHHDCYILKGIYRLFVGFMLGDLGGLSPSTNSRDYQESRSSHEMFIGEIHLPKLLGGVEGPKAIWIPAF